MLFSATRRTTQRGVLLIAACSARASTSASLSSEPPVSRLLLVRHGETNFNFEGRLQGRLESELTEVGHAQAIRLGEWLAGAADASVIDRVFVSPRRRTRQTLADVEVHATALPAATVRHGLREIELTQWEGQLRTDLRDSAGRPDMARWARWKASPSSFAFEEDGHSPLGDLSARAAQEWRHIVEATPAGTTSLVVAHGAFNRVLMLCALGLPVDDRGFSDSHFDFENTETVEVRWTSGAHHASAWRRRYPSESAWRTREQELERRERIGRDRLETTTKLEL